MLYTWKALLKLFLGTTNLELADSQIEIQVGALSCRNIETLLTLAVDAKSAEILPLVNGYFNGIYIRNNLSTDSYVASLYASVSVCHCTQKWNVQCLHIRFSATISCLFFKKHFLKEKSFKQEPNFQSTFFNKNSTKCAHYTQSSSPPNEKLIRFHFLCE